MLTLKQRRRVGETISHPHSRFARACNADLFERAESTQRMLWHMVVLSLAAWTLIGIGVWIAVWMLG